METSSTTGSGGGGSKRRKTAPSSSSSGGGSLGINSLTEDVVVAISDYLPKTSRALLAVALTAPSSSWRARAWMGESVRPCAASAAIVASEKRGSSFDSLVESLREEYLDEPHDGPGGQKYGWDRAKKGMTDTLGEYYGGRWELLDFVDIPKTLASRLTDDDLGAVLACIDAKNNLTRLKLTHCVNVVGHGLDLLRTSNVLEKIEMSLVRTFERPRAIAHAKISEEAVLPIIADIVGREGNAFRRLQVPQQWLKSTPYERPPRETSKRLLRFMKDHERLMVRASSCCYFGFGGRGSHRRLLAHLDEYGLEESTDSVDMCHQCGTTEGFGVCSNGCGFICCDGCEGIRKCGRCRIRKCSECNENEKMRNQIVECDNLYDNGCGKEYCKECLFITCRNGTNNCGNCKGRAFDRLKEESDAQLGEIRRLRAEVKRLRQREIGTKVAMIRRLAGEVKTLQKAYGKTR